MEVKEEYVVESLLIVKLVEYKLKSYIGVFLIYNKELIGVLELGLEDMNVFNSVVVS